MPRRKGSGSQTKRDTLRQLFRDQKVETLFIAVPGIGTKPSTEWTDAAGNLWLTSIKAPGIGLFTYEHEMNKSGSSMWQDLLDHGQILLKAIVTFVDSQHLQHCPILLIGHSLGGFIVKETLRLVYERTDLQYKPFKKSLAGAILMGTPHTISSDKEKWQKVALLPYVSAVGLKTQTIEQENIKKLADSSLAFDQGGIVCPILTVCEKRETKLKHIFNSRRIMLVDVGFAQTGSREEEVIEVDSNHRNLCNVSDDGRMFNFIATVLEDARLRIASDSPLSAMEVDELDETGYDMAESSSNPTSGPDPFTASNTAGSTDLGFEVLPLASALKIESEVLNLPCYSFTITRNKDFYGREQIINRIGEYFSSPKPLSEGDDNNARSFALCGPGGMGKTQIAAEYVHRCRSTSAFDAIFWLHADEQSKLSDGFGQIAVSLGLVSANSIEALDPVITANLTKGWLSNPVREGSPNDDNNAAQPSWLVVLDNTDDLQVLEGFWPFEGPGCVLITSQDPLAKEPNVLADAGYDLQSFTPDEASGLIEIMTKRKGDGRGIGERLGGLPLAIAQMASIIIRNHMTFEEFIETWDENKEHPEYLGYEEKWGQSEAYGKNLSTTWAIESLRHGKSLLEVIAFLDSDTIQESVLKAYSVVSLEYYPTSSFTYLKARKELLQTSLISRDSTDKNIAVHRMIQEATRSKMGEGHYRDVFTAALLLISHAWPFESFGWRHGVSRWPICQELFPHVLRLKNFGSGLVTKLDSRDDRIRYCKLMNDAGWYYHETGHFTESQSFIEEAQSVAESTQSALDRLEPGKPGKAEAAQRLIEILAETHHNLGCIGTESNQPQFTLTHFRKFNEMMIAEIDEERQKSDNRLAISWNELGNAYMMNKMWFEGERCFKKCLEVAHRMVNFAPAEFSFPYVNLGLAYWLTNRFDEAKQTLEEGLQYRVAVFGHDDKQSFITGRFLYALGNVAASQGRLHESFDYHDRALRQFLSTIGENHHRTGDIRVKVALHHHRLGNLSEARMNIDEASRIFSDRAIFKPEMARATFFRSIIVAAIGEHDWARRLRDKSLQAYYHLSQEAQFPGNEPSPANFDDLVAFWSR